MLAHFVRLAFELGLPVLLFGEGLGIKHTELKKLFSPPGLFVRSFLSVIVVVPLATLLIIRAVAPQMNVAVGMCLLAASPVVPLVMNLVRKARGDEWYGMSLHAVLAALSVITVPLVLVLLAWRVGFAASVRPRQIGAELLLSVFIPMGIGMFVRARRPQFAERYSRPVQTVSFTAIAIAALLAIGAQAHWLAKLNVRSYVAMFLMILAGLLSGHLLARKSEGEKTTLAIESAARNPAIALYIARLNFPDAKLFPVLVPYLVTFIVLMLAYRFLRRWRVRRQQAAPA